METKFTVGQRVWDAVIFPNEEGMIIKIQNDGLYSIVVKFNERIECYTKDGSINVTSLPTLNPRPYTIEFKEIKIQPIEGKYYFFWNNGTESAIYQKYVLGIIYDNISETPPF
jgi:hypothetical protein